MSCCVVCKKPNMNFYLKPFVEELQELYNEGIRCTTFGNKETILVKVHTLVCSVDTVARPMVQNMKQFNGQYGCSYCLHKGKQISVGRRTARIYQGHKGQMRSITEHNRHINAAIHSKKTIKGVKGLSITSMIPNFNILYSCPPEYMHSCLLGVAKLFA